ncbi:MAG: NADP transhydrogenase subunit alpha [Bdellovibrionales bacterium RIFOXYC1_FULL_54_43]|nr:MAG: NADP transhydrogenase subunit alpha [Bdellovibrionales bacterium RIFOXYC1_FULL_54_43]OFZ84103.1 MAG: NADP transhydrogenase subunit alpha [Bdellovibrionales bacterium RIFOXYD1_FULL_55_31]
MSKNKVVLGVPKETKDRETRVAGTPTSVKKWIKQGFRVIVERSAGASAGFPDEAYSAEGAELGDATTALGADVVLKLNRPTSAEVSKMKRGALLISFLDGYLNDGLLEQLAQGAIDSIGMELLPRTSRAQSMDALSSQANIAGYRAALEAATRYKRFFPMMMTSAGSAKPAKVAVLGAGVAGLQAIPTAKKLGAAVEGYDIRPEVKEQIISVGAKFIELDLEESGIGTGGYAKELSEAGKQKQQALLNEKLKKFDIIISTANIPGRKAPVLITEEAVKGMRFGSVIIDMAASTGGNCPLTEPDKIVVKHGVTIVGITNWAALVPADASEFYARNVANLLALLVQEDPQSGPTLKMNLEDDIIAASLAVFQGEIRFKRK